MHGLNSQAASLQLGPDLQRSGQVQFQVHVDLLRLFIARRDVIVGQIEGLLNSPKRPLEYQQDVQLLERQFKDCFYTLASLTRDQTQLRDQLELAHWACGFKPRGKPGNDLVDPLQMLIRALHMWQLTRWPGQKGRLRYAHTLFNLYLVRCVALLSLRLWDSEPAHVSTRLTEVQAVLDQLWSSSPTDQPRLVRDVRWLIPVALSPTTDDLGGYFRVAAMIEETFASADRIETQKAWVQTGAGHLCSQLRHLSVQRSLPLSDSSLVLITRKSNALDIALLVQGLVTLLTAYEACLHSDNVQDRMELATAICQGLSPDPDLFVNRLDLLGPYSMIEHLFVVTDSTGQTIHTAMGLRHLRLLGEYEELIARLAQPLLADFQRGNPVEGTYSPYGALYGFSSNLLELMAFRTLLPDAAAPFSLEDVFTIGDADKRAWVNGWRKLPHIKPEVVKQFEYSQPFVEAIGDRIDQALRRRVTAGQEGAAITRGRLLIQRGQAVQEDAKVSQIPELPSRYVESSDKQLAADRKAITKEQADLLHCRLEGEYLVSYQTPAGWVAISKDLLTEVLGAGRDARVAGVPLEAADILRLMCPKLIG